MYVLLITDIAYLFGPFYLSKNGNRFGRIFS